MTIGRCTLLPVIEDDLEDIARELKGWVNGDKNEKLDKWFEAWKVKI